MAMLRSYKLAGFSCFIHGTSLEVSDSPSGDTDNDRITGRKGKAIADPKLFRLPGSGLLRDYCILEGK
jgi:hypothetical protein